MLAAPARMLSAFGFPPDVPHFFPSQSGIFLVILGISYLLALAEPSFVLTILVSKALAVVFLLIHAALLSAPPIIYAAAAGDGAMLAAMLGSMWISAEARPAPGQISPPPEAGA